MSAVDIATHHRTRLLEVDPDLAEAIPRDDRVAARRLIVSEARRAERGPWSPDLSCRDGGRGFALLIASGLMLREVVLADRRAAQVFGPGDVLRPSACDDSSLAEAVEWTVMEEAVIAILDDTFLLAARRWPRLGNAINDRLFAQVDRMAVHLAIAQLPRIEQRLLGILWHLA